MKSSNAAAQLAQLFQRALTYEVDPTEPVSSLGALERQLKEMASEISHGEFLSLFEESCSGQETDWASLERSAKLGARRDGRYSLLLNFAREHDAKARGLAGIVWQATWPIERAQEDCYHVECALQVAQKEAGERRAIALLQAAETLGARVYEPYLRSLIKLTCVSCDTFREVTEPFGVLVKTVTESKAFATHRALVDASIRLYRNACAHRHYEFELETGKLKVWDSNEPPRTVALDDLEEDLKRAYVLAGPTFLRVRELLAIRDQGALKWEAIGSALVSGDEDQLFAAINSLQADLLARVGQAVVMYRDWTHAVSAKAQKGKTCNSCNAQVATMSATCR